MDEFVEYDPDIAAVDSPWVGQTVTGAFGQSGAVRLVFLTPYGPVAVCDEGPHAFPLWTQPVAGLATQDRAAEVDFDALHGELADVECAVLQGDTSQPRIARLNELRQALAPHTRADEFLLFSLWSQVRPGDRVVQFGSELRGRVVEVECLKYTHDPLRVRVTVDD